MTAKRVSTLLLLLLLAAIGSVAVPADQTEVMATVTVNAPIFIGPEVSQTPLRIAVPGTVLNVLQRQADWIQVEFKDPQWGRRVGWVRRSLVTIHMSVHALDLATDDAKPVTAPRAVRPCLIVLLKKPLSLDTSYVEGDLPRGMKFRSKISYQWIMEVKKYGGMVVPFSRIQKQLISKTGERPAKYGRKRDSDNGRVGGTDVLVRRCLHLNRSGPGTQPTSRRLAVGPPHISLVTSQASVPTSLSVHVLLDTDVSGWA